MLYPLPLHCCRTLSQGENALTGARQEGCSMHRAEHRQAEQKRPGGCGNCAEHAPAGAAKQNDGATERPIRTGIAVLDAAGCNCTTVPHASVDEAVLASAGLEFHPPVAAAVPAQLLVLLPRLVGEPVFKIGSSPPFMADKSHHTYLHTASLLI